MILSFQSWLVHSGDPSLPFIRSQFIWSWWLVLYPCVDPCPFSLDILLCLSYYMYFVLEDRLWSMSLPHALRHLLHAACRLYFPTCFPRNSFCHQGLVVVPPPTVYVDPTWSLVIKWLDIIFFIDASYLSLGLALPISMWSFLLNLPSQSFVAKSVQSILIWSFGRLIEVVSIFEPSLLTPLLSSFSSMPFTDLQTQCNSTMFRSFRFSWIFYRERGRH